MSTGGSNRCPGAFFVPHGLDMPEKMRYLCRLSRMDSGLESRGTEKCQACHGWLRRGALSAG